MTELATDAVVSGVPYAVSRADGTPALTAIEFVGDTTFRVHQAARHSWVSGVGVPGPTGGEVRFYEKDPTHEGRDVRVWRLQVLPGRGVTALHDAAI
ncbi:MAG: hypothetical protein ABJA16_09030 [Nakamurella sp.]